MEIKMEVKAKCVYDYESIKALTYLLVYKGKEPTKRFIMLNVWYGFLFFITILMFVNSGMNIYNIITFSVLVFCICIIYRIHYSSPKKRYNALCKMRDIEQNYIFCDEVIKISLDSEYYKGEAELKYSMIPKIMETSKFFFIYRDNTNIYIVDKTTISGGTQKEIREKFKEVLKDNYKVCKY